MTALDDDPARRARAELRTKSDRDSPRAAAASRRLAASSGAKRTEMVDPERLVGIGTDDLAGMMFTLSDTLGHTWRDVLSDVMPNVL
jgi:hypothetical protein